MNNRCFVHVAFAALRSRIESPMTRARSPGGFPNDDNVAYYARRAVGEVGLILSEGTLTRRRGAGNDA
jgi:2,4-dienoyl-CoA reductase-like NADH-dependent reductase (Old Yellow Enzyme family)